MSFSLDQASTALGEDRDRRRALLELLEALDALDYGFVTVTPSTHARVVARPERKEAHTLRDVFGWSLPFSPSVVPANILRLMQDGDVVEQRGNGMVASTVRVSSVHGRLFLHSAYPTVEEDSVFLGPDSYRFADLILAKAVELKPGARIVDYAAGAGVGGITVAAAQPEAELTLADINPKALFLCSINAEHAGLQARPVQITSPSDLDGLFDLIVTHPPFMIDADHRAYRDGGDLYGARLSLDWVLAGAHKLTTGGRLILHTGVSIVDGRDVLRMHLEDALEPLGCTLWYHELDPDIFGEELGNEPYREVERIAAVGACVVRES